MAGKIIASMDSRGAWIADIKFLDTDNYADNPPIRVQGIDTNTYVSNMNRLITYLGNLRNAAPSR